MAAEVAPPPALDKDAEGQKKLLERRLGVTSGMGTGVGGALLFAFTRNPIILLSDMSCMPTDDEIKLLVSYQEFKVRQMYRNADEILAMPVPACEGHNTTIFAKGPSSLLRIPGWCYRKPTWSMGPLFFPHDGVEKPAPPPWTLSELLDRSIEDLLPKQWQKWKKEQGHA